MTRPTTCRRRRARASSPRSSAPATRWTARSYCRTRSRAHHRGADRRRRSASTASDYGRFVRMFLNGGELDGARVLKAETVALMGQNAMGAVRVPALKTPLARSADFTFIADGRDQWGLGFLITIDQVPGKRSPGSLSWGGINNTYFWIDPTRGIAGVIMMQYLPFADAKALAVYDAFERGAYQLVNASGRNAATPGRHHARPGVFDLAECNLSVREGAGEKTIYNPLFSCETRLHIASLNSHTGHPRPQRDS